MTKKELLQKARRASRDERILRPFLAFFVLTIAVSGFFELIPYKLALILVLPPALASLTYPTSRGAPSYSELVELIELDDDEVDPIVDVLSRKR